MDHWTHSHHALNHSLHHVERIMCLRSKSHVKVAKAGEVVQQAGGLHVLEFHGPTAGALGALVLVIIAVGLAWVCCKGKCRPWRLCCPNWSGSSSAPQGTLALTMEPTQGRLASWMLPGPQLPMLQAQPPLMALPQPAGQGLPVPMMAPPLQMPQEQAGGTQFPPSPWRTPSIALSKSFPLAPGPTGTVTSQQAIAPTTTSTLTSWMTPPSQPAPSNPTPSLNPFRRTPSRTSWRPSFSFGQS
ncbi:MAG: hypothetical protein HC888_04350 [Candidatus Competibacteraceae bacterium]|nr:hypothetical protein [Candidatus Competibacteraceae bacterium]